MITVSEVVENVVRKSPFLEEALSKGIINISALARLIRPEVQREAMKDVKEGAIGMALNRLAHKIERMTKSQSRIFSSPPDLMLRSNLFEVTFANSDDLAQKRKNLLEKVSPTQSYFFTLTQGIFETTIIASKELKEKVLTIFGEGKRICIMEDLSSITVQLPQGIADSPGAYSYILRVLAWKQINIVEVVSTLNEFTIILRDAEVGEAFFTLKSCFELSECQNY